MWNTLTTRRSATILSLPIDPFRSDFPRARTNSAVAKMQIPSNRDFLHICSYNVHPDQDDSMVVPIGYWRWLTNDRRAEDVS